PTGAFGLSLVQDLGGRRTGSGFEAFGVHRTPVGFPDNTAFIADPAATRTDIAENNRVGLMFIDRSVKQIPVVHLLFAIRSFPVGPVKPYFKDIAVTDEHFGEHVHKYLVVLIRAVSRVVPVPGGKIDPHLQPVLFAGFRQLPQYVALPVFPAAFSSCMRARPAGPEAEPTVMFGRNDNSFHSRLPGGPDPLVRIQRGGVEYIRIFVAMAPFHIGKRIRPKMDK